MAGRCISAEGKLESMPETMQQIDLHLTATDIGLQCSSRRLPLIRVPASCSTTPPAYCRSRQVQESERTRHQREHARQRDKSRALNKFLLLIICGCSPARFGRNKACRFYVGPFEALLCSPVSKSQAKNPVLTGGFRWGAAQAPA